MDIQTILTVGVLVCIFLISLPFEAKYSTQMQEIARHAGARFIAGCILLMFASLTPLLGGLVLLFLFLWFADIRLLSSIKLGMM